MRKTRSDSKLMRLPEEQQAQLAEWLMSGMPYYQAQSLVEKEFGLRVASLAPFSHFHSDVCVPLLLRRRSQAVETAQEVANAAQATPGRFDAATIDALKQKAFELSVSPQANPKDVKSLMMLVLKARDQDLTERRVRLLEQKAAQAEQAEQIVKSELTPEEKQQRIRQIFGMQ